MANNKLPSVSIIIPTLNEADYLGYLLFSLGEKAPPLKGFCKNLA